MSRVKTFAHGGILVDSFRSLTKEQPFRHLSLPSLALIPLVQYEGAQAQWVISTGDRVLEEQVLAVGLRPLDVPVHSPIPGIVEEFREIVLPQGVKTSAALIRLEGTFNRTGRDFQKQDWSSLTSEVLLRRLWELGVFLESSTLDSVKNILDISLPLEDLIINGLQSEPYLTLPLHLMEEKSLAIAEGIRISQKIFSPKRTHFAADSDHPEEWEASFSQHLPGVLFHPLRFKYPQAQEKILYRTLLERSVRANESLEKKGCLILDIPAVVAVYEAVVEQKPLIEKHVVLSGEAIVNPGVYRVRIGTPLAQFLKDAGGFHTEPEKILMGGPFRGYGIDQLSTPITKSTQAILALSSHEVNQGETLPCIRCGECVSSCPVGLQPVNLFKALTHGNLEQAYEEGLNDCVECGICAFVCPSRIPLLGEFQRAKGERA